MVDRSALDACEREREAFVSSCRCVTETKGGRARTDVVERAPEVVLRLGALAAQLAVLVEERKGLYVDRSDESVALLMGEE